MLADREKRWSSRNDQSLHLHSASTDVLIMIVIGEESAALHRKGRKRSTLH